MRAAVENGADAIYLGLDTGFNARARATNFKVEDLSKLLDFVHRRNVKGYVTLNTLAFPSELPEIERIIQRIAAAGVDAVLVQDIGVARLVRAVCPQLPIHASTQMTLTSSECIEVAKQLGIERVVLARELSIEEIAKIRDQTDIELEAFVHGALCVAYSGQCLTSESLGGRSANRGQCAQACRLPYELTCDGKDVDLGDVKYLLSPQDLAAYELTPELIEAGICSFKIEGRLKSAEYVANITRHYRESLDEARHGRTVQFSDEQVREMELSFSRGFSPGWFQGCDHKMLVPGLSSAKRGVLLGEVIGATKGRVKVKLAGSVARGDGIVFEGDRANDGEQGGRVFGVYRRGQRLDVPASEGIVELAFAHDAINIDKLASGQRLWKTDDPQLTKRLRKTFSGDPKRRVALDISVIARTGKPLKVTASAANGATATACSDAPLEAAVQHRLDVETLKKQLGRLGATNYALRELQASIADEPMVPLSVLGKLRRKMIEQLDASAITPERTVNDGALHKLRATLVQVAETAGSPTLRVLCRTLAQLRALAEHGEQHLYADLQDIREYKEAVPIARLNGTSIYLATPRIQKPGEVGIFRALMRHGADGILVRNLAGLAFYHGEGVPTVADFSLNVANELTAQWLIEQGASRLTASYDLNRQQLLDLVQAVPPGWLEVVVHQHMPMFHMEHCVFCAVLSPGTNKTNCGRPCDVHQVTLRDRIGKEHPLTADVGCRNTLFNATPQSAAEAVPTLIGEGVRDYRIELLHDEPTQALGIVDLYRSLLAESISGEDVWRKLHASNRVGVTRGTLEERRNPLAII